MAEVVDEPARKNISISRSEVAFLGKKFIAYLNSEEYLIAILGDCISLEQRFSQIDAVQVREYLEKQHVQPLNSAARTKSLIKQETLPDRIVQLFQKANLLKSNGLL